MSLCVTALYKWTAWHTTLQRSSAIMHHDDHMSPTVSVSFTV